MSDEKDISAETSETAKAVQDVDKALGSPLSLLLGPTFKLIGEHWGKKADAYLNPKQVENLEEKITIAKEGGPLLLGNETKPRQIAALMEWTDAAHDVDGTTKPQLSKAWARALRDISEQNYTLLDSLAKLDEDDVNLLRSGGALTKDQFLKLQKIGVLERPKSITLFWRIFDLSGLLFVFAFFLGFGGFVGLRILESVLGWQVSGNSEPLDGWSVLIAVPIIGMCLVFPASTIPGLKREFFKKTNIARTSTLGRDIILKLDGDAQPVFTYSKNFLPKNQRRSPILD